MTELRTLAAVLFLVRSGGLMAQPFDRALPVSTTAVGVENISYRPQTISLL